MKAILMSIQPKWCELIASGEKTIEVRKTAPKDTPFKVYMYCTKAGYMYRCRFDENHLAIPEVWNGKVVGEFICERVTEHEICDSGAVVNYWAEGLQHSCLTVSQIDEYVGKRSSSDYGKKSKVYGWHISDLKIYDKPKELYEFVNYKKYQICKERNCFSGDCLICPQNAILTSPPKPWLYVEEMDYDR